MISRISARNRNLKTSKAPLESQAQGSSSFTNTATNQRGCPKDSKFRPDFQRVRGDRVAVYGGCRFEREWEDGGSDESGYESLKSGKLDG